MHALSTNFIATRALVFAAAIGAPLVLAGCVVEPNPYYAQPAYAEPVYAAPASYPYYYAQPAYVGPSVYIGGGGGWRGGGWRR